MKANDAQNNEDWMAARAGAFTASRASDLMARTKTGPSASRQNLIATLAVERITGKCVETFQNDAMRRGIELEAEARDWFSFEYGVTVDECGFIAHSTIPHCGCSPDGLIGDDELLEIKCPASMSKHLAALRTGEHAKEYAWQLQHQMLVTDRKRVRMLSYDPRFPAEMQGALVIVERDEAAIADLVSMIASAEREVQAIVAELQSMTLKRAA